VFYANPFRIASLAVALLPAAALGQTLPTPSGTPNFASLNIGTAQGTAVPAAGTFSLGALTATGFGTAIGNIFPPLISNGGHAGINLSDRLVWQRTTPTSNDFADIQINRNTTAVSGGTSANINGALIVNGTIGPSDGSQEWNFQSLLASNTAGGSLGVATYNQAKRNVASGNPLWAEIDDMRDQTGLPSSTSGNALVSLELDMRAMDVDDGSNPSGVGGTGIRKIIQPVCKQLTPGSATQTFCSSAIWVTQGQPGADNTHIAYGNLYAASSITQAYAAFDARGVTAPTGSSNPVAAVSMTAGQAIDLNGSNTISAAPQNYLAYDSGTNRLKYYVAGVAKLSIDASGNIRAAGTITGSTSP